MSDISYSDTSSIFTNTGTITSFSSTIPGIGALSGKAFKRFGSAVVNGVDTILIRRRLAQIETTFEQRLDGSTDPIALESLYSDLLELSRPVYSLSIRTRAFRLIMGRIGAMDVEYLAAAVASWPLSESYELVKAMILSLRLDGNRALDLGNTSGADRSARLEVYCAAGLDAYKSHLPYSSLQQMSRMSLCMAFLLYMGLTVLLSKSPAFSRLAIELDLITFITDTYPGIVESKSPWLRHLFPARIVLSALLDKLDPDKDAASITRLQKLMVISPPLSCEQSSLSNQTIFSPTTTKGHLSSIIHSNIAYLQSKIPHAQKRILLLGCGETGKTTLKKQMMRAYRPHNARERAEYIESIVGNAIHALYRAADGVMTYENWGESEVARDEVRRSWRESEAPIPIDNILKFHQNQKSRIHSHNPDYNDYFFDSLPRIISEGYLPSDEDIVRCYIRTLGIHTETIELRGDLITLLDFGGHQCERKKWIRAFQKRETELVFFVASLSEYNEVLYENQSVNRMQESLTQFESIINNRHFEDVPVILFLNKTDLFAQKLRKIPLKNYFSDYSGGDDYSAGCRHIIDRFLECDRRPSRSWDTQVYLTSFIDDEQTKNIMNEIYDLYMDPVLLASTTQSVPPGRAGLRHLLQAPMKLAPERSNFSLYYRVV